MKKFNTRAYSISDFREWHEAGRLQLAPKFQRRRVWSEAAKSYLIDTILRGKPIPKVFFRSTTIARKKTSHREIVDGQQRLAAILDFLDDGFRVASKQHPEFGGLLFSELPETAQDEFLEYEISADLLINTSDADVLDIFARVNSYSVTLNAQEKLNAKFIGEFKSAGFALGLEFHQFWTQHRILTDQQILRMADAQLASELLVAMIDGFRSRKRLESYYRLYEPEFPYRSRCESRFRIVMDQIGDVYSDRLAQSNWLSLIICST